MLGEPLHNNDIEKKILAELRNSLSFEKGFRLLVQTYQERLYWHIQKMLEAHQDTDEVLQNTFIKIYRGIHNFRGEAKLYTWLYRIATNECLTYLSKKKKQQHLCIDDIENGVANSLEADDYFDEELATILLKEAIETLPDKQRQVFVLRYYNELSYKEISAILETSVGGLKASYHHAVKKIESFVKTKSE